MLALFSARLRRVRARHSCGELRLQLIDLLDVVILTGRETLDPLDVSLDQLILRR